VAIPIHVEPVTADLDIGTPLQTGDRRSVYAHCTCGPRNVLACSIE